MDAKLADIGADAAVLKTLSGTAENGQLQILGFRALNQMAIADPTICLKLAESDV